MFLHGIRVLYYLLTAPASIFFILHSRRFHPAYRMHLGKRMLLGLRMFWNRLRVPTLTNPKAHLAMAMKILEFAPEVPGDVLECGTYKGGTAVNLSLVCRIAGRKLKVYDSFAGLPPGEAGDREAAHYQPGDFTGTLAEVRSNIERHGAPECCQLIPGWFQQTLPSLREPVLLAYLDVDLQASLHTCVKHIWPNLVEGGYIFIDECASTDYCALFYSESWWHTHFGQTPPGLIGAGTGLPLGEYFIGPYAEAADHPLQHMITGAYTRKGMSGFWSFRPQADSGA